MSDFMTFADIYGEVERAVKGFTGAKRPLVKHMINQVYLNELIVCDDLFPLYWLVDLDDSLASKAKATITGITKASPPVVTAAAHGFADGNLVSIYDVSGMVEVNNRTFLVDDKATDTFELQDLNGTDIVGAGYTTYTSGGEAHHRGLTLTGRISRIIKAMWHDEQKMDPIDPPSTKRSTAFWNDNTSRPTEYFLKKKYSAAGVETNQLIWGSCSDAAYDLRLWKEIGPSVLSADGNVPLLPPEFHPAIVAGAITRLAESAVQVEAGVVWPTIYANQLNALRTFNRKFWKENELTQREKAYLL